MSRSGENGKNVRSPSLRLVSFERDLDPLKLAVRDPRLFPHLRHGAPHEILKSGAWHHSSGLLHWELQEGDFLERLETAKAPDLIFYDPFSYKTDAELWTSAVFSRIFEKSSPRSAELYTYSASTAVRVALLTAGFFVAEGVGTGPKANTTIAFTRAGGAADTSPRSGTPGPGVARPLETQSFKIPGRACQRREAGFRKAHRNSPQFLPHAAGSCKLQSQRTTCTPNDGAWSRRR